MSDFQQQTATVSVVIPAYNAGGFLDAAVASAYAQSVAPSEVIVINDGSTDNTEECLRRLASTLPPSFAWKTKRNGGGASARNVGVRDATGTHVAFLDHDDTWHPTKLERQLHHFASVPDLAMSFTGYRYNHEGYRSPSGRAVYPLAVMDHDHWDPSPHAVLEQLLAGRWCVGTMSTVMIRRAALAELPPFDEGLTVTSDISMYLEVAAHGMKMDYLREPLVDYRWHGNNVSRDVGKVWEDACQMYDQFWETHGMDLPQDLRSRASAWRAHWHLQTAIDAIRHGDKPRARQHIVKAARIQPSAIRPGWVRMLGIGSPPAGPWPE